MSAGEGNGVIEREPEKDGGDGGEDFHFFTRVKVPPFRTNSPFFTRQ